MHSRPKYPIEVKINVIKGAFITFAEADDSPVHPRRRHGGILTLHLQVQPIYDISLQLQRSFFYQSLEDLRMLPVLPTIALWSTNLCVYFYLGNEQYKYDAN
jgi:hypothetical protein